MAARDEKLISPKKGFSLIEMLVVISIFGLLAVIGSRLFLGTLSGSNKSEALKEVRQNGQYSLKVMEEIIKNAYGFVSCNSSSITIKDKNNFLTTFSLDGGRIASTASNQPDDPFFLTGNAVKVENFLVTCGELKSGLPPSVGLSFDVSQAAETARTENKAKVNFSITVSMRNPYEERVD